MLLVKSVALLGGFRLIDNVKTLSWSVSTYQKVRPSCEKLWDWDGFAAPEGSVNPHIPEVELQVCLRRQETTQRNRLRVCLSARMNLLEWSH